MCQSSVGYLAWQKCCMSVTEGQIRGKYHQDTNVPRSNPALSQINKNTKRHTAHTIVSWHNPKQWVIVHTSDLIMIIRQSIFILNHRKEMGKLKTHSKLITERICLILLTNSTKYIWQAFCICTLLISKIPVNKLSDFYKSGWRWLFYKYQGYITWYLCEWYFDRVLVPHKYFMVWAIDNTVN